jgi:hypothetical protein
VIVIPLGAQFPGLHADERRKAALHLDSGRQRAPKYGHLGNLAVRVDEDVIHSVDRRIFDLQPEKCGGGSHR